MNNKERFLSIVKSKIKREGIESLIKWIEDKSDFYTAPASTKYHLCREGGLLEHSLNVYDRLVAEINSEYGDSSPYSEETIAIVSLFHDFCKINFYAIEMRNAKDPKKGWISVPYYTVKDTLPFGHGEKSQYITSGFIKLTREESMAIRWHMGFSDEAVKGGSYALNQAMQDFPLILLVNVADMKATYFDEKEEEK